MKPWMARLTAGLFVSAAAFPCLAQFPLASVERACERIGGRLQSVGAQMCLASNLKSGGLASHRGMPLLYRDFMPGSSRRTPFRVLLIGGIHGDELSSVSIVFQWMQKLEAERLQPFHWRVIPALNPDGLLPRQASRVNARGVDLNRNFATPDWSADALSYWKRVTRSDPRRYPGAHALSEPETRFLVAQIEDFKPDAIISVHAPFGILDYDGPLDPPQRFGYLRLQPLGIYPGSLGNYAGVTLKLPTITLELPHAGIMPSASQSQRVWADMLRWLESNLPKADPPLFERLDDPNWLLR
ncbi:M14 family murein peptide amidase A [Panacagrimonas sp.]|uniref:M14 family murein peptide amidase A n=1 Tax=Panacagrimonas sp. TaxID=2480088 RepID=UPI003B526072